MVRALAGRRGAAPYETEGRIYVGAHIVRPPLRLILFNSPVVPYVAPAYPATVEIFHISTQNLPDLPGECAAVCLGAGFQASVEVDGQGNGNGFSFIVITSINILVQIGLKINRTNCSKI